MLLRPHHLETAQRWFDHYGAPVVFFGRMIPIVRTFISLPAGFGKMKFWKFTLFTLLGCVPWVLMLGCVGTRLGSNWEKIRPYLHYRGLRRRRGGRGLRGVGAGEVVAPPRQRRRRNGHGGVRGRGVSLQGEA